MRPTGSGTYLRALPSRSGYPIRNIEAATGFTFHHFNIFVQKYIPLFGAHTQVHLFLVGDESHRTGWDPSEVLPVTG